VKQDRQAWASKLLEIDMHRPTVFIEGTQRIKQLCTQSYSPIATTGHDKKAVNMRSTLNK
jgi:hypothetical protein